MSRQYTPSFKKTNKNSLHGNINNIGATPISYSPKSIVRVSSSNPRTKSSIRHRQAAGDSMRNRLSSAVDEASYYKHKCRELEQTSKRWKNEAQSLTHSIAFGDSQRPQTPRSESRKLTKSPMRRKRINRAQKRLIVTNDNNSQVLYLVKCCVIGIVLYLFWDMLNYQTKTWNEGTGYLFWRYHRYHTVADWWCGTFLTQSPFK
jgi:hypothetical protein